MTESTASVIDYRKIHEHTPTTPSEAVDVINGFIGSHKDRLLFSISNMEKAIDILGNSLGVPADYHFASTSLLRLAQLIPKKDEEYTETESSKYAKEIGEYALRIVACEAHNIKENFPLNQSISSMLVEVLFDRDTEVIDDFVKKQRVWLLKNSKDDVDNGLRQQDTNAFDLLKYYAKYDRLGFESFREAIDKACDPEANEYGRINCIAWLNKPGELRTEIIGRKKAKEYLSTFGYSDDEIDGLARVWRRSQEPKELHRAFADNLRCISRIEKRRPGIAKRLTDQFGIKCFGRYPEDVLIEQNDFAKDSDNPYGIIIFPSEDYNGGFYQDVDAIDELFQDLYVINGNHGVKFNLRIYESKDLLQVGKAIVGSNRKWGKISFLLIGGHGSQNSISFAFDSQLTKQNILDGAGIKRISTYFVDDPTVGLISCSTGKKSGIGHEMSKLGATVIGPRSDTNVDIIAAHLVGGKLDINITYSKGTTSKYRTGVLD
ncbi:MAG: hypothetical protein AAB546_02305 [Patescibacteria group bacterium]